MDFNSLKDQVSNLSLYDLKAGVRKVQNGKFCDHEAVGRRSIGPRAHSLFTAVMNYTEMEAKVFLHGVSSLRRRRDLTGVCRFEKLRTMSRGGHLRR